MCPEKFKYISLMWKHINEQGHHVSNADFLKKTQDPEPPKDSESQNADNKGTQGEKDKVCENSGEGGKQEEKEIKNGEQS